MSTNNAAQQLFNWPADGDEQGCDRDGCDQRAGGVEPACLCSTCRSVIGVNAVTCDECWHYCMGDTSP